MRQDSYCRRIQISSYAAYVVYLQKRRKRSFLPGLLLATYGASSVLAFFTRIRLVEVYRRRSSWVLRYLVRRGRMSELKETLSSK